MMRVQPVDKHSPHHDAHQRKSARNYCSPSRRDTLRVGERILEGLIGEGKVLVVRLGKVEGGEAEDEDSGRTLCQYGMDRTPRARTDTIIT
jgi:hypothetical protein